MLGIPATLTYINTAQTISGSPQLIPYPDWQGNAVGDCVNGLNTVYRIKADKCGRLWVLDTGTIGIGNTTQNICPYSVNVFDLATNTRIRRYEFRAEDTNANTFIANTAVDIGKSCEDTFAYFSDELGYGLIVYSWEQNRSWRFDHSYFYPDPLRGDFNIGGLNFQWGEEGIFGMALSPTRSDGFRTLYFSPLASHREFSVSTRILRDESRAEDSYHDFFFFPIERSSNSHTTARVCSDDGIMLFNLVDQNAVGCWHTSMPYEPQYHGIVDRDDVGLVFPADVKIDENRDVWVLSDRMPVFLIANLDYTDINFRIYSAPLQTLIGGTVCDISNRISGRFGLNSILSTKPTKTNIFGTNNIGLGAFKSTISPDSNSIQAQQPLIGNVYDVREPLAQTFTTKLPTLKTPSASSYFKGTNFGATYAQTSSDYATSIRNADYTSSIRNIPKASSWWTTQLW